MKIKRTSTFRPNDGLRNFPPSDSSVSVTELLTLNLTRQRCPRWWRKNKIKNNLVQSIHYLWNKNPTVVCPHLYLKKRKKRISDHRNHSTSNEGNHLIKVCGGETHQTQIFLLKIKMEMELFKWRVFASPFALLDFLLSVCIGKGDDVSLHGGMHLKQSRVNFVLQAGISGSAGRLREEVNEF